MSWKKEFRDFFGGFLDISGGADTYGGIFGLLGHSEAGAEVNEKTSMTVGAVAACQRIISSAVASMGCYVYERMPDGGHRLATDHPLFNVLSLAPSNEYPAVDFYSAGQVHLLQNGNTFAEVIRNNGGQPVELLLRSPFRTHVYRNRATGAVEYKTTDTLGGKELTIPAENMVHVKNMGIDPYIGMSPIRLYMREVIGTALAAQAYGARLFKNDTRPGGYLKSPNTVKPGDKTAQIQSWVAGHRGGNNHMPAYLDGGVEWANVGINPEEAQFLQTRQFQRSEIASIYGVPAHMLGDPQETKATIEQKALEFLLWTVKIWLRRWEHAYNVKLFPTTGRTAGKFFAKFDTSEFERADYATMLKGIQTGRYAGLYSVDEGRKLLGLNPSTKDNFDPTKPEMGLWRPVNMAVAGEDPATYTSGGAGAGSAKDKDNPDAPAEDQPDPADDGGDDSRAALAFHLGKLDANLDQIKALSAPPLATWVRILRPVFESLAGGPVQMPSLIDSLIIGSIVSLQHDATRVRLETGKSAGVDGVRKQAHLGLQNFQNTVRAILTHPENTPCE